MSSFLFSFAQSWALTGMLNKKVSSYFVAQGDVPTPSWKAFYYILCTLVQYCTALYRFYGFLS